MTKSAHLDVLGPWSAVGSKHLIELLNESCKRRPDDAAMLFEDGVGVSRKDLAAAVRRFAGWLSARVSAGDRIAIVMQSRIEYMIAIFAIIAVRGVVVSVNPDAKSFDAAHVLRDSGATLVIVDSTTQAMIADVRGSVESLRDIGLVDGPEPHGLSSFGSEDLLIDLAAVSCQREDITTVYYTSGTTGLSKGCMASHARWLRSADLWLRLAPRTPSDRTLCCTQFYYSDAFIQLLMSLHSGGPMVVMRRFSVSRFWKVVSEMGVTDLLTIASMPLLLLKAPPSSAERQHNVRYAIGVGIPPQQHRELVERFGFPWLDNYGISEAGLVSRVPIQDAERMIGSGSIGIPVPEVDVRIVGPDGEEVKTGALGEMVVRSLVMFSGYLNQPEATRMALRDGWYHTGDLVRRDENDFLYFVGRTKDMVRRSGENVAAAEIEEVLRTHPRILDAAVVARPDDLRGEEIHGYVQLVDGETINTLPPADILRHCAERLASFKVPRFLTYQLSPFPRTPSLRIRKTELDDAQPCWDREAAAFVQVSVQSARGPK